jgi:hypothetical protein
VDESVSTGNRTTGQPLDAIDKADQAAREAIIALLSHAHTAAIITAHADALRALVPYAFAPDQVAVTDLGMASSIWPATGIAWLRPEGVPARGPVKPPSDWPVLVDQNDSRLTSGPWAAGWPGLPEDERAKLHAYVGEVRAALVALANDLADAGAPVDPGSPLDICVLAQLSICWTDFTRPVAELAANMNHGAPFAVTRDGRGFGNFRDGTGVRLAAASDRIRQWWRAQQEDDRSAVLRADSAQGGRRTARTNADRQQRRREALRQVLSEYRNVAEMSDRSAASYLYRTYGRPNTAGARLAELLGGKRPADTTLAKDLATIRRSAGG